MYGYEWDVLTHGYTLTTKTGKFVANELRPVFAEELNLIGFNSRFEFEPGEKRPLMWAQRNLYFVDGEKVAQMKKMRHGEPFAADFFFDGRMRLAPVDIETIAEKNAAIMNALVADTQKRIKEMYDSQMRKCDVAYIGFSGGKDSVVLLELCHRVLPLSVPVVFSDTDMELPDTYAVWNKVKEMYPDRPFIKVSAETQALENWRRFGPPSRALRWCCSVHKSSPAILALKTLSGNPAARMLVFVGVRGEESLRRLRYEDIGDGLKSRNQVNAMPILDWSAHEIFLFIFRNGLNINEAYRYGLPRVGCLLCPMSNYRQTKLIEQVYSDSVRPFVNEVKSAYSRAFSTQDDAEEFILSGGWHARKSGVSLRDVIDIPTVENKDDSVAYLLPTGKSIAALEWLKTLGKIERSGGYKNFSLRTMEQTIDFTIEEIQNNERIKFSFLGQKQEKAFLSSLSRVMNKAICCVGCRSCEAECPTAALTFGKKIEIDAARCVQCQNCHSPEDGCLRYFSKRYAGGSTMNISGINKYMTFGLKPEWIAVLAAEKGNFRTTRKLGNRMVPSAVTWFRESGLIEEGKAIQTTALLTLGEQTGFVDSRFWYLIWMGLVNRSPLIKWYVCNAPLDEYKTRREIDELLSQSVESESVRRGALQSLTALLKSSPLGAGEIPLVKIDGNRSINGLRRLSCEVDSIVILYGLYVMAGITGRGSFTIREMMSAQFDAHFISPLAAFGIPPEKFEAQCLGLSSKYSDFINCSFTHGLDELQVFSEKKNFCDVMDLILQG